MPKSLLGCSVQSLQVQRDLSWPDYRRAPESKFPAQIDDVEKAYNWLLDQGYRSQGKDRDHQAGKTRARTNVQPRRVGPWREADELGAIDHVAVPDFVDGRLGDQILALVFLEEQSHESLESGLCST